MITSLNTLMRAKSGKGEDNIASLPGKLHARYQGSVKYGDDRAVSHYCQDDVKASESWAHRQINRLWDFVARSNMGSENMKSRYTESYAPKRTEPAVDFDQNVSFEDMALITLDAIGDAVLIVDSTGRVIYLNKLAETLTGWPITTARGCPVEQVFCVIDGATQQQRISPARRAMSEGCTVDLALGAALIRHDGTEVGIEDSASPIRNRHGAIVGAVIVFHDARQSGVIMSRMSHLAQHDFLTGLPNRMLLVERLAQALRMANRHGKKISLLFLDLDSFKQINDTLGHAVGDLLLQDVAADIVACVRETDTVSRHGGDEFVILLSEIEHKQDAARVACKIRDRFAQPRILNGLKVEVTLSIGISVYPDDGADADTLLNNADIAMYSAKGFGRNHYQFCHQDREPMGATIDSRDQQIRRSGSPRSQ